MPKVFNPLIFPCLVGMITLLLIVMEILHYFPQNCNYLDESLAFVYDENGEKSVRYCTVYKIYIIYLSFCHKNIF